MSKTIYTVPAYDNLDSFIFGHSKKPVSLSNGMVIGGGTVYPEINFTLPPLLITKDTLPEVLHNYKEIITGVCERSRELSVEGFIAEIEVLPPLTFQPDWGAEVCRNVVDIIKENEAKYGVKGAVRYTPVDIREGRDLEHMYRGKHWELLLESFVKAADAGAEILAIESVGGKETHDEAIMYADLKKSLFALSIIGCPDMEKLWTEIVKIAKAKGVIPGGDTACGFANTAMVLADKGYIPKVFAATVRVMSAVRNLVSVAVGAQGPHKDCGYENVYVKAITGTPVSLEGRSAACAHLSPIGNIAGCVADLWSNESIQNIKLLGGMAPTVSFEQLVYDCRLFNTATAKGHPTAVILRDLHCDSDSALDPQAYVLRPDVVLEISKELAATTGDKSYYIQTKKAAELALKAMKKGLDQGQLILEDREEMWLDTYLEEIETLSEDEAAFAGEILLECEKLDPAKYDLTF